MFPAYRQWIRELCPPLVLKIARKLPWLASAQAMEMDRLRRLPRYQATTTPLLGRSFDILDAPSFLAVYQAYFLDQAFQFDARKPDPVILDCGANVGVSVAYWKFLYPAAQIMAFEPDPDAFRLLERNCRVYTNVVLRPEAVWTRRGCLDFFAAGADGGRLSHLANCPGHSPSIPVPTVRLRDLLDSPLDLLKIDIEGAEVEVLLDGADRLAAVDRLFVEYHDFTDHPQKLATVFAVLEKAGYRTQVQNEAFARQPFLASSDPRTRPMRLNIFCDRISLPSAV